MDDKQSIRRQMISLRDGIDEGCRRAQERGIADTLFESGILKGLPALYAYMNIKSETDITPVIKKYFEAGRPVFLPRCIGQSVMDFYEVSSFDQLEKGSYGIMEPKEGLNKAAGSEGVVLVPGVCYSESGARIGYGAGYYDSYLSRYPKLFRIGICYLQQLRDITPDEHDMAMDWVIAGKKLYRPMRGNKNDT